MLRANSFINVFHCPSFEMKCYVLNRLFRNVCHGAGRETLFDEGSKQSIRAQALASFNSTQRAPLTALTMRPTWHPGQVLRCCATPLCQIRSCRTMRQPIQRCELARRATPSRAKNKKGRFLQSHQVRACRDNKSPTAAFLVKQHPKSP